MTREVMQLALEAQERMALIRDYARLPGYPLSDADRQMEKSTAALREALAQPEAQQSCDKQEPVAKVVSSGEYDFPMLQWLSANHSLDTAIGSLLYASPPRRQPLPDEQQIAADLRFHGLTLVKTATGYAVLKISHAAAHDIGGGS